MRIVFLSDIHNHLARIKVPPCDVLAIAGDLTMMGRIDEISKFNYDVGKLKDNGVGKVICCAGNHDWIYQRDPSLAKTITSNVDYYLEDAEAVIDDVHFYGSPWQPEFGSWAYNLPRQGSALKDKWDLIPYDLDVLITHGPPYGVLDETTEGEHVGCHELLYAVQEKRPKYHIFGHIHPSYGQTKFMGTTFINASTCNERYRPVNPPVVIDL